MTEPMWHVLTRWLLACKHWLLTRAHQRQKQDNTEGTSGPSLLAHLSPLASLLLSLISAKNLPLLGQLSKSPAWRAAGNYVLHEAVAL